MINWKTDAVEELVFPSNTSIISKHLIEREMTNAGLLDVKAHEKCKQLSQNLNFKNITKFEMIKKMLVICEESSKNDGKKEQIIEKLKELSEDDREK